MNSWKVENPSRLLTEVKNKFSGLYTVKDLRWSIEHNRCFVNQKVERFGSAQLKKGDSVSIFPEKIPFLGKEKERILYEDDALLVYDKPPYLSSENLGHFTESLLVHRLDRDTSGVMLFAKNKEVQRAIERQFKERLIQKEYLALVEGIPGQEGVIQGKMAPLHRRQGAVIWGMASDGLFSQTQWKCLEQLNGAALLHCFPLTGRTHQIRVHLKHIGHPIVGDYAYGARQKKEALFRPLLHALLLTFTHPLSLQRLTFSAPLPSDFAFHLESLNSTQRR